MNDERKHAYLPLYLVITVAAIALPMLARPFSSYSTIATGDETADSAWHVDMPFASLSSWSQAISNLDGFLPYCPASDTKDFLRTWWTNLTHENPAHLLPTIGFPSSDKDGKQHEIGWDNFTLAVDYNGVYMPVLPLEPPDASFRESEMRVQTQILAVTMNCTHAEISDAPVNTGNAAVSLSVGVRDPWSNCTGNLTLPGFRINEKLRRELMSHFTQPPEAEWDQQTRDFWQRQVVYLLDHPRLTSFAPGWSRLIRDPAKQGGAECRDRLAIAGLPQVFLPDGAIPTASASPSAPVIEAAICETHFVTRETELRFHRQRLTVFRQGSAWDQPALGELSRAASRSEWRALPAAEEARLREAFFATATSAATALARDEAPSWPMAIIDARVTDVVFHRTRPIGIILVVGRWLRESLMEQLAIAAELVLREGVRTGLTPVPSGNGNRTGDGQSPPSFELIVGQDRPGMRVVREVLQARPVFRATLLALLGSIVLAASIFPRRFFASPTDRVPWPLHSPVAQALLLRHSPIRVTLRKLAADHATEWDDLSLEMPGMSPKLQIGYWRTHRRAGRSGWRLDSHSFCKHAGF
jgi:hypothetical protein